MLVRDRLVYIGEDQEKNMENLSTVEAVNMLACIATMFFLGLQIEPSRKVQNIARILQNISLVVVWICIFLR